MYQIKQIEIIIGCYTDTSVYLKKKVNVNISVKAFETVPV